MLVLGLLLTPLLSLLQLKLQVKTYTNEISIRCYLNKHQGVQLARFINCATIINKLISNYASKQSTKKLVKKSLYVYSRNTKTTSTTFKHTNKYLTLILIFIKNTHPPLSFCSSSAIIPSKNLN